MILEKMTVKIGAQLLCAQLEEIKCVTDGVSDLPADVLAAIEAIPHRLDASIAEGSDLISVGIGGFSDIIEKIKASLP